MEQEVTEKTETRFLLLSLLPSMSGAVNSQRSLFAPVAFCTCGLQGRFVGDAWRSSYESAIFDADGFSRGEPAIARDTEETAALDHLASRLGHRRDAKLHSAGERLAIPGWRGAAMVFLPDAEPGEIRALPDV